jgi:hypothetical protein
MREHTRELSSARHILTTIKATARTMALAALSCAIFGIALVEVYGYIAIGTPSLIATHVLAVIVGLVCAYGAIVTVLLRGMIATLVDSVELVAAEIERLTSGIVHEAETVEGTVFRHGYEQGRYRFGDSPREAVGMRT